MTFIPDAELAPFWEDLGLPVNHDADVTITLLNPTTGDPYDLTGLTVNFYIKPGRTVPDSAGTMYECTVVGPPTNGIATVNIPEASITVPGIVWYRVDLVSESEVKSPKFGNLTLFSV
jgi:hypothetical protein